MNDLYVLISSLLPSRLIDDACLHAGSEMYSLNLTYKNFQANDVITTTIHSIISKYWSELHVSGKKYYIESKKSMTGMSYTHRQTDTDRHKKKAATPDIITRKKRKIDMCGGNSNTMFSSKVNIIYF